MKKQGCFAERVYPVLFMALVTIVCISLTSGIFLSTEELVRNNETLFIRRAVLYSAGLSVPPAVSDLEELYRQQVREIPGQDGEILFYEVSGAGGDILSLVTEYAGPGLWGEIIMMVGFSPDLGSLTGLEFTKQNETPGLGGRITEPWFKEQFRGKEGPFVMVQEGTSRAVNELDSITGATRTSDYVLNLVNAVWNKGITVLGKGAGND